MSSCAAFVAFLLAIALRFTATQGFTALLRYCLSPATLYFILLFSSCTIAPSAWKQQCNYNPCFVFARSTVFNMGPFFKISVKQFQYVAYACACCEEAKVTMLFLKLYCVGTACVCRNSIFIFSVRIKACWNTFSAKLSFTKTWWVIEAKMVLFRWKLKLKQDCFSSEMW